jgi:formylglycine-generating enzyme required for sulfatase activity
MRRAGALLAALCLGFAASAQEPRAGSAPGPPGFRDRLADGSEGPEMVVVPAGRFRMGDLQGDGDPDELPAREVSLARPFALGRHELTFEEYERFCRATGSPVPDDGGFGRGRHPVVNVTWQDALAYAVWLAAQTGQPYRLPSEAEWEYAAGGEASHRRAALAVPRAAAAAAVGAPQGVPADGRPHVYRGCGQKVIRGGFWVVPPREIRSANRWREYPVAPSDEIGFRVARDLER